MKNPLYIDEETKSNARDALANFFRVVVHELRIEQLVKWLSARLNQRPPRHN